jgi:hypothetical protein
MKRITKAEKQFFTHANIQKYLEQAETFLLLDFNVLLGGIIKEKYESIFVKIVEITHALIAKGAAGYFWVVASPTVASIFKTAQGGYSYDGDRQEKMGVPQVIRQGLIDNRWRLWEDNQLPEGYLLIGCNWTGVDPGHVGKIRINNMVI